MAETPQTTARSITDVPGIQVGHAHDATALTGCTAILPPPATVGAVDVRGGGPGTRETDLLSPVAAVSEVHALILCGGSAYGLAAATGAMAWLREQGIGFATPAGIVPIVPAAVIYDLAIGQADRWADAAMGYAACAAASSAPPAEGNVGVGMGATVGKALGADYATKSGVGTWSETLADGTVIGALVVCNAFGEVYTGDTILAGVRSPLDNRFVPILHLLRQAELQAQFAGWRGDPPPTPSNTTLAVVATTARLSKAETQKLAQMAHAALAHTIRPIHTPLDGDTVFALATGSHPAPHLAILGALAVEVLAEAVRRAVRMASTAAGIPALSDLLGPDPHGSSSR